MTDRIGDALFRRNIAIAKSGNPGVSVNSLANYFYDSNETDALDEMFTVDRGNSLLQFKKSGKSNPVGSINPKNQMTAQRQMQKEMKTPDYLSDVSLSTYSKSLEDKSLFESYGF